LNRFQKRKLKVKGAEQASFSKGLAVVQKNLTYFFYALCSINFDYSLINFADDNTPFVTTIR